MDPISVIIILLAAYGIATRIPAFARAQAAARQKAGDWASAGGDWLGGQRDRARGAVGGVRGRIGAAIRDAVPGRGRGDTTARFVDPPLGGGADGGPEPTATGPGGSGGPGPGPGGSADGTTDPGDPAGPQPGAGGSPDPGAEPGPRGGAGDRPDPTPDNPGGGNDPGTGDQRPPIYVGDITPPRTTLPPSPTNPTPTTTPAGAPAVTGTATAVLEGPNPMSDLATRGGEVTGVVSGAAEARAIEAQIRAITEAFVADLTRIQTRLYALGDATLSIVQFAGTSDVVAACAGAAEALASAKGAASNVTGEVSPALLQVAKQFDARNS